MDRGEAYRLLLSELTSYRELPYDELVQLVGTTFSHRDKSHGIEYVIDIEVAWRDIASGEILIDGMVGGVDWGQPNGTH